MTSEAHGSTVPDGTPDVLRRTALHESGHVFMRAFLGLPTPFVSIDLSNQGEGFTQGTGDSIDAEDSIYISLAGYAAELGRNALLINFDNSKAFDFEEAANVLNGCPHLRGICLSTLELNSVQVALRNKMETVLEIIERHQEIVHSISDRLLASPNGRLSRAELAPILHPLSNASQT